MSTITHDHEYTSKQKDMDKFNLIPQTIVSTSIIQELKRLQLDIDEANKIIDNEIIESWGRSGNENGTKHYDKYEIVQSNTARIAEIIINEL